MIVTRQAECNFHVFKRESCHGNIKAAREIRVPWNSNRAEGRSSISPEIAKSVNRETFDASLNPGRRLRFDMQLEILLELCNALVQRFLIAL